MIREEFLGATAQRERFLKIGYDGASMDFTIDSHTLEESKLFLEIIGNYNQFNPKVVYLILKDIWSLITMPVKIDYEMMDND